MALVAVASADNEAEATMVISRLRDEGIPAIARASAPRPSVQFGSGATQTVYVEDAHEARARELLDEPQISDDELARLAAEAGPPPAD